MVVVSVKFSFGVVRARLRENNIQNICRPTEKSSEARSEDLPFDDRGVVWTSDPDVWNAALSRPVPLGLKWPAPRRVWYCREYLSRPEEENMLRTVPEDDGTVWSRVTSGRLVAKFDSGKTPALLARLRHGLPVSDIDHILLNSYAPGQGIMLHTDGPAYIPVVAVLSLGQDRLVYFAPRLATIGVGLTGNERACAVLLRRRSLLVFDDCAYIAHTHGLDDLLDGPIEIVGRKAICANLHDANTTPGEVVHVTNRRLSITFRRNRRKSSGGTFFNLN